MLLRPHRRRGFSPVELLVVLAFLLLLIAFLAPILARVREAAVRAQSLNNLKQMGLAMHNFAATFNSKLPAGIGACDVVKKTGTIHLFLLPYIEQAPLYQQATNASWDNDVWSKTIPVYLDPRDPDGPPGNVYHGWLATTNYAANGQVFSEKPRYNIGNIPDGTSNTLAFTTRLQLCSGVPTAWGYPSSYTWAPLTAYYHQSLPQFSVRDEECDPTRPQAIANVLLVGMCDGSARTVDRRISAATWRAVCLPDDGTPLGADF